MDIPCIVCQENCPVSPKAIFTREYFSTIRGGVLSILGTDQQTLKLDGNDLREGHLATGDYYLKMADKGRKQLIRIVENTSNTLTIAGSKSWQVKPGSQVAIQVRLQRPYVDPSLCIGCGICEHECPVSGKRAIRVTAENETRSPERSLIL
jgi:Pyruvate/2-oxoacid:ferredoxin oxidoreductase delta subunit